jgi:hypothetical protein
MKPIQLISQDLFDKVRSRFTNLEMGDETGAVTIDPAEARFFDFDFVNEGVDLGRVSISLNDLGSLKIYYSQGITENQDDQGTQMWYNFLKEMRLFAMRRLLRFDTRDIAKTNLDKNDFQHLAATQGPKEEPDMNTMNETKKIKKEDNSESEKDFKARQERLAAAAAQTAKDPERLKRMMQIPGYAAAMDLAKKTTKKEVQGVAGDEQTMNESRWNHKSSSKTSRAVQGKTEVIVRHESAVDETYAGARSQGKNIKAIFIQNADGERAKYPFIHLAGAFAMAQHVDHGGVPHDPAGKAIIKMSEDISKLGEFQRHIQRSHINADAHGIAERAIGHMNELKAKVAALGKRHHYQAWREDFEMSGMGDNTDELVLDAVTLEDYKNKFTQTNFQEELVGFFPLLHSIMREANTIDLEEYVSEQDIDEATALQSLGGNPRFNQNRPMPQQGAAPWEDDVEKLATIKRVDRYSAYANIRSYFKDNPELSQMASDLMGGYYEADMLRGNYKTVAAKAKYDELEPIHQAFIKQALGQEQGDEEPPFEPDTTSNFSKPNNRNRTGMDSARALAQRGMSPAESINAFEEWADATEKGELTPDQLDNLKTAIEALPQGPHGPQLDAEIANDFFNDPEKGLTKLPNFEELTKALQDEEGRNEEIRATPLQLFQAWATDNNPDLLASLGMTGAEEPAPAPETPPAPAAPPAPEQPVAEGKSSMVQEVAKIVKSFYNADNESVGPFRAEENIALDCKKQISEKFGEKAGEQAYEMAEAFINKLTQEWQQKHGKMQKHSPVDQGDGFSVDSLKEILGRIKGKVEGMGQPEMEDSKKDFRTHGMDSKPSKGPKGNPPPTEWKTDPIAAATDRAHDAGSKLLQRLAGIRKK